MGFYILCFCYLEECTVKDLIIDTCLSPGSGFKKSIHQFLNTYTSKSFKIKYSLNRYGELKLSKEHFTSVIPSPKVM